MAAELGLVGLLAFGLLLAGVGAPARAALRRDPAALAAGAAAARARVAPARLDRLGLAAARRHACPRSCWPAR